MSVPTGTPLICGLCYDEAEALVDAPCAERPERLKGAPIGMYHCPDCGTMVLAGLPHPQICRPCRDRLLKPEPPT